MEILNTIQQMREWVGRQKQAGRSVGLAPTMGALHEGHMSLIDAARAFCDAVVVSIFVNPIQFGPNEDLSKYPRTPQQDLDACKARSAAAVFMPTGDEMYPPDGRLTDVTVRRLGDTLCGANRPGHFTGVCTVVAKLFNIVQPDKAFFGAKDYQQATILRRMAADLDFPVEIVVCPIIREADGLAMSSRNVYLAPPQRRQATVLHKSLQLARQLITEKRPPASDVIAAMRQCIAAGAPGATVDYIHIVDPDDLTDVQTTDTPVCIALAVRIGTTRLIDNMVVDGGGGRS